MRSRKVLFGSVLIVVAILGLIAGILTQVSLNREVSRMPVIETEYATRNVQDGATEINSTVYVTKEAFSRLADKVVRSWPLLKPSSGYLERESLWLFVECSDGATLFGTEISDHPPDRDNFYYYHLDGYRVNHDTIIMSWKAQVSWFRLYLGIILGVIATFFAVVLFKNTFEWEAFES